MSGFNLLKKKLGHSIFSYDFYIRKKTLFPNVETQIIWLELKKYHSDTLVNISKIFVYFRIFLKEHHRASSKNCNGALC